jgi:hypothetical protein
VLRLCILTKEDGLGEEKTTLRSLSSRLDLTNTGYESLLDDAFSADKDSLAV